MATKSKPKKPPPPKPEDMEKIQSDVASFASSLGLASSFPSSGFDDSDFRPKKKKPQNAKSQPQNTKSQPQNAKSSDHKPSHTKNPNPQKPNPLNPLNKSNDESDFHSFRSFDKFKNLPKLPLVKGSALGSWYVDMEELEEKVLGKERKRLEIGNPEEWKSLVAKKKQLGERLLAQYTMDYESSRGQSGDIKMLIATQKSGTAADKVSAYSVLIGDNPIANMRALDALLSMVTSKVGKRHALTGFEALKELVIQSLLPDRKLKTLFQRPVNQLPETKDGYSLLLFWYWEECLRSRYERFVGALEEASKDMLRILKDKALKIMCVLLKSKSEQERRLLTALVNKLGDPDNKAASNADFYLTNLLSDHPNMKIVVIDEVDTFLFRPHLGLRAKYHAVNFLSQIRLSHKGDGPKVAKRLVDVYFALFKVLISVPASGEKDKGKEGKKFTAKGNKAQEESEAHVELDSRLLSALLTGVNRAFPFVSADESDEVVDVHTPMLFQLAHSQNFNVGIQALMLIDKISSRNQVVSDRFYRALYAKLLLPAALNTSKAEMFIGLLLRAMKNDVNLKRVAAFAKRLLQVILQQPPQYACGCLFLLSEILKARPPLWNTAIQNEAVDEDMEHFEDVPDETENVPDADAAKTPQSNDEGTTNNTDGDSSEDEEEAPSPSSDDDDDESDEDGELFPMKSAVKTQESNSIKLSDHNEDQVQPHEASKKHSLPGGYDPRHREPSFCNADRTSWWELTVLASHAHPSVSTMARTLLSGANIVYNGNPLNDLSLTAFLDKFMEKKPKQTTWHGGSQIEPAKKLDMNKHLIGPEIVSLAEDDVPPEDVIFHKFYVNKMGTSTKLKKKKKKKKAAEEVEAEELYGGDDDSDNEEIDKVLDAKEPSLESDGEYDYDDLDKVANEDDDDLVGNASDNETGMDGGEPDDDDDDVPTFDDIDMSDDDASDGGDDDDDDDDICIGDVDDDDEGVDDDDDEAPVGKKGKRKSSASPFASLEEYEHLLNDDDGDDDGGDDERSGKKDEHVKSRKKRKSGEVEDSKKAKKSEKSRKPKKKSKMMD